MVAERQNTLVCLIEVFSFPECQVLLGIFDKDVNRLFESQYVFLSFLLRILQLLVDELLKVYQQVELREKRGVYSALAQFHVFQVRPVRDVAGVVYLVEVLVVFW